MGKSTNKTSAAIERLSTFGDILLSRAYGGYWEVRVYDVTPAPETKEPTAFGKAETLDDAICACLRKIEDRP